MLDFYPVELYNSPVRRLAFLLHIYQPPTQHEQVLREIADQCYLPLIKLIKEKRFKVTLNIPLSLLEQMDKYGYKEWLSDIKELYETEKIELVGSGAYHPLLTKIPSEYVEQQVILNEYALGYYFGKKGGFDGDPSIMIRDLKGFFPPELAVNEQVLNVVNDLGYEWMLVDEVSIPEVVGPERFGVYKVGDFDTKVIARNRELSTMLASQKDLDANKFVEKAFDVGTSVISLDGEVFGHHNEEGIVLLRDIISALRKKDFEAVFVTDYLMTTNEKQIKSIVESTWNTSQEDTNSGNLYPMWDVKDNEIHKLQWEIFDKVVDTYKSVEGSNVIGYEEVPIWIPTELEKIEDESLKDIICKNLLVNKSLHSCQFWWGTHRPLKAPSMIEKATALWRRTIAEIGDKALIKYTDSRLEKITNLMEEAKS